MDGTPDIEFEEEDPPVKGRMWDVVKMIVKVVVLSYLILWFTIYFFHSYREPIREFFDKLINQLIF